MVRIAIEILKIAINLQKIYVIMVIIKEDYIYADLKNHRRRRRDQSRA